MFCLKIQRVLFLFLFVCCYACAAETVRFKKCLDSSCSNVLFEAKVKRPFDDGSEQFLSYKLGDMIKVVAVDVSDRPDLWEGVLQNRRSFFYKNHVEQTSYKDFLQRTISRNAEVFVVGSQGLSQVQAAPVVFALLQSQVDFESKLEDTPVLPRSSQEILPDAVTNTQNVKPSLTEVPPAPVFDAANQAKAQDQIPVSNPVKQPQDATPNAANVAMPHPVSSSAETKLGTTEPALQPVFAEDMAKANKPETTIADQEHNAPNTDRLLKNENVSQFNEDHLSDLAKPKDASLSDSVNPVPANAKTNDATMDSLPAIVTSSDADSVTPTAAVAPDSLSTSTTLGNPLNSEPTNISLPGSESNNVIPVVQSVTTTPVVDKASELVAQTHRSNAGLKADVAATLPNKSVGDFGSNDKSTITVPATPVDQPLDTASPTTLPELKTIFNESASVNLPSSSETEGSVVKDKFEEKVVNTIVPPASQSSNVPDTSVSQKGPVATPQELSKLEPQGTKAGQPVSLNAESAAQVQPDGLKQHTVSNGSHEKEQPQPPASVDLKIALASSSSDAMDNISGTLLPVTVTPAPVLSETPPPIAVPVVTTPSAPVASESTPVPNVSFVTTPAPVVLETPVPTVLPVVTTPAPAISEGAVTVTSASTTVATESSVTATPPISTPSPSHPATHVYNQQPINHHATTAEAQNAHVPNSVPQNEVHLSPDHQQTQQPDVAATRLNQPSAGFKRYNHHIHASQERSHQGPGREKGHGHSHGQGEHGHSHGQGHNEQGHGHSHGQGSGHSHGQGQEQSERGHGHSHTHVGFGRHQYKLGGNVPEPAQPKQEAASEASVKIDSIPQPLTTETPPISTNQAKIHDDGRRSSQQVKQVAPVAEVKPQSPAATVEAPSQLPATAEVKDQFGQHYCERGTVGCDDKASGGSYEAAPAKDSSISATVAPARVSEMAPELSQLQRDADATTTISPRSTEPSAVVSESLGSRILSSMQSLKSFLKPCTSVLRRVLHEIRLLLPESYQAIISERDLLTIFVTMLLFTLYAISRSMSSKSQQAYADKLFKFHELSSRLKLAEVERDQLVQRAQKHNGADEQLKTDLVVAQQSAAELETQLKQQELELQAAMQSNTTLLLEKEQIQKKATELEKQLQNAGKIEQELRTEETRLKDDVEAQTNSLRELRHAHEELLQSAEASARTIEERSQQNSALEASATALSQQVTSLEQTIEQLTVTKTDLEKSVANLTEELGVRDTTIETLRSTVLNLEEAMEGFSPASSVHDEGSGSNGWEDTSAWEMEDKQLSADEKKRKVQERLDSLMNVARIQKQVKDAEDEKARIVKLMNEEIEKKVKLEKEILELNRVVDTVKDDCSRANQRTLEAETRLQVLSDYFKTSEAEMKKQLGVKEVVALQHQEALGSHEKETALLKEEVKSYRERLDELTKLMEDADRKHREEQQIKEKQNYEYWNAKRQAEKERDEAARDRDMWRKRYSSEIRLQNNSSAPPKDLSSSFEARSNSSEPELIRPLPLPRMSPFTAPGMMSDDPSLEKFLTEAPPPFLPGWESSMPPPPIPPPFDDPYFPSEFRRSVHAQFPPPFVKMPSHNRRTKSRGRYSSRSPSPTSMAPQTTRPRSSRSEKDPRERDYQHGWDSSRSDRSDLPFRDNNSDKSREWENERKKYESSSLRGSSPPRHRSRSRGKHDRYYQGYGPGPNYGDSSNEESLASPQPHGGLAAMPSSGLRAMGSHHRDRYSNPKSDSSVSVESPPEMVSAPPKSAKHLGKPKN